MKVVTYVYNALSKVARRLINTMKTTEIKVATSLVLISLGFSLLVAALVYKEDARGFLLLCAGILGVLGGISLLTQAYNQAQKDEARASKNLKEDIKQAIKQALIETGLAKAKDK